MFIGFILHTNGLSPLRLLFKKIKYKFKFKYKTN